MKLFGTVSSPVGVGFSHKVNVSKTEYYNTDESTCNGNYDFLVKWFEKYPEFKNNDFYIV